MKVIVYLIRIPHPATFFLVAFVCYFSVFGQDTISKKIVHPKQEIDSLYREDQFYTSVTFNLLLNTPVNQSGFSGGLHLGYIRDMPINRRRNVAIGLGVGYSVNTYGQSLFIGESEQNEESIFIDLEEERIDFNSNRFVTHLIEAPIEFRWRTSVPQSHKFWRIYTGLKVGYLYRFRSNFDQDSSTKIIQTEVKELNRWRVGATVAFGWNTFNFYFHYSLNPLFDSQARIREQEIGMTTAKFGLIFYIL